MEVANWEKWQTFRKDRGTPPWIKVYRNLLSNEQWVSLSDKEKGHLVSIWILAADKNGILSDDPSMIQRMCMLDSKPNINKFIDLGFLVVTRLPLDNQELNLCHSIDAPEKRRVEKSRVEKSRVDRVRHHFLSKYKDKVGKEYLWSWGKDSTLLKGILSLLTEEEVLSLIDKFFSSNDEFIKRTGYTMGVFKSQINKLRVETKAEMNAL